nr:hypothetical protein [Tanacetum cinerariifolium]
GHEGILKQIGLLLWDLICQGGVLQLPQEKTLARKCRSPKDTRRNGAAEPQKRNVPVETSTSNALVSQCDGMGSYDWSFQAEEEPTNYALITFTSSSSSSSDNEVPSCSKACTKAYATLQSYYDKLTGDFSKSQFDVISYKTGLKFVEARLLVYQQNETVFKEDIKLLKLEVQLRDNALLVLRQNFEKAEQERDDLKSDQSFPPSPIYDRYQSGDGYHAVPLPYTGTFMPPKPDLVFYDAPNDNETVHTAFNVSDSEDDSEDEILQHAPSFVQPIEQVKTPMPYDKTIETCIPPASTKTTIPKPKSNGNRMNQKACFVCKSLDHLIKDCDFYEKKMAQTSVRNHVQKGNHQQYAKMKLPNPLIHVIPTVVLTKSKHVPITATRPVTAAVPNPLVTKPRQAQPIVTKPHTPPKRNINRSPSPKASTFPPKAEEEPTNYALMAFTSSSSSSSDNEVPSCSKASTKAYATLQSYYDKLTGDFSKSQFDVISYKTGLKFVEARLLVYQQNETVFKEDIKLLKLEVQLRDNALLVLRQNFEKAEQERDDLKVKLEKFQTSSKNLSQLLASQTNDKTGLGYNT